jgi:hypothetical protein
MDPEINLSPTDQVGLIVFSVINAEGHLDRMATQYFLEDITYFQRDARIIELEPLENILHDLKKDTLDLDAIKSIGEKYNVQSIFVGKLVVSDVKPRIGIGSILKSLRVQAEFTMDLSAKLLDTGTGSVIWTDSIHRKGSLAHVHLSKNRIPHFDIRDQETTYQKFIKHMVQRLTRDFRPSRQRSRRYRSRRYHH